MVYYVADSTSMWGLHNIAIAIAISTRNDGHCQEFFRVLIFCTVRRKNCFFCQPKYTECIYIYIYVYIYMCVCMKMCVCIYTPCLYILWQFMWRQIKAQSSKSIEKFLYVFQHFFFVFHSIFMIFNHSALFRLLEPTITITVTTTATKILTQFSYKWKYKFSMTFFHACYCFFFVGFCIFLCGLRLLLSSVAHK